MKSQVTQHIRNGAAAESSSRSSTSDPSLRVIWKARRAWLRGPLGVCGLCPACPVPRDQKPRVRNAWSVHGIGRARRTPTWSAEVFVAALAERVVPHPSGSALRWLYGIAGNFPRCHLRQMTRTGTRQTRPGWSGTRSMASSEAIARGLAVLSSAVSGLPGSAPVNDRRRAARACPLLAGSNQSIGVKSSPVRWNIS